MKLYLMPRKTGTARKKMEIDKGIQPDFPLTIEIRQSKRGKNKKKYNPYGEDFVVQRLVVSDMMDSLVGLDQVAVLEEIDLVRTGSGVRTRSGTDS